MREITEVRGSVGTARWVVFFLKKKKSVDPTRKVAGRCACVSSSKG